MSASITVDVVRAESSRFRHPILMIHGLWTGGWVWRRFAPYLAHRGWDCWLPSFLDGASAPDANDRLQSLVEICQSLPGPPVVIGHDAGIGLAALLANVVTIPATVAIAPLGTSSTLLRDPQFWSARLFTRMVRPPRGGLAERFVAGLAAEDVARLRPDSGRFFRALARGERRAGAVVAPPSLDVPETAGHFPMLTTGWDDLADRVHRWLVQTIGAELLVWQPLENGPE